MVHARKLYLIEMMGNNLHPYYHVAGGDAGEQSYLAIQYKIAGRCFKWDSHNLLGLLLYCM
jgi:hypothetical protein